MSDRGFEPGRDVVERRDTPHRRICVLVLGMHRSGTSALTRVLSLLGAELPKTLIGSGKGNDTGHWEPARLVALHDQTLKEIGSRWDDWRAIDLGALAEHRRHQLREEIGSLMLEEYGTAPLLVVKDPRICRFAPLYIDVLADLGIEPRFVLPLRNPLAVMASLAERDNMTPGFAALLWLRHVLDAEAATRSLPRAIVSYEALLADWHPVMRTVAAKTGLRWPRSPEAAERDISAFLIKELQHFAPTRRELSARKDITGWVKEAYRALLEIEMDADNEAVLAVFDRVRAEFDAACPAFGAAILQELAARESQAAEATARHQRTKEDLALTLKLRTDDIESLRAELSARDQEIGGLNAELVVRECEIAQRQREIAVLSSKATELATQAMVFEKVIRVKDDEIAKLVATVRERDSGLALSQRALAARDTEVEALKAALLAGNAAQEASRLEIVKRDREIEKLSRAREGADARATSLGSAAADSAARVAALELHLRNAQSEASRLDFINKTQQAQIDHLQLDISSMRASSSWRLTQPLRSAVALSPKSHRVARMAIRSAFGRYDKLRSRIRLARQLRHLRASSLFDAEWYLAENPDVRAAGLDPALHYLRHGAAEGRSPGPNFDGRRYLSEYPDVAASGVNPLIHYVLHGRLEGRTATYGGDIAAPFSPANICMYAPMPEREAKDALRRLLRANLTMFLSGCSELVLPSHAQPQVSIILILHNQAELTYACLCSILQCAAASSIRVELIIWDNCSTDATAALLGCIKGAKIIAAPDNIHFLRAVNKAVVHASGEYLLLLNNDAQLHLGALDSALETIESSTDVGAVGGRIVLPDGSLQEAGSIVWNDGSCAGYGRGDNPSKSQYMFVRDVDYCSAVFLLTRRDLFGSFGGFDEAYAPAYYEETDYCARLRRAGYRIVYNPRCLVSHYEFGSARNVADVLPLQKRNQVLFQERHCAALNGHLEPTIANRTVARTSNRSAPRILVIDDRVPHTRLGSGFPRANSIINELVRSGALVTLWPTSPVTEAWPGVRAALADTVEVILPPENTDLAAHLSSRKGFYNAIWVSRPHNMARFLETVDRRSQDLGNVVTIYDAEAIAAERDISRRRYNGENVSEAEAQRLVDAEMSLARRATRVIAVSARERDRFRASGIEDVLVLGHALQVTPTDRSFSARTDLLFVGSLHDEDSPNADSVRWFCAHVLPHVQEVLGAGLTLHVVGINRCKTIAKLAGSAVTLVGSVEDLRPYFDRARVFVAPTRYAAGIPHKIHEAARYGVPVVATELLARQIEWQDGRDMLVANEPLHFAESIIDLFEDEALWKGIRDNAIDRVAAECSISTFQAIVRDIAQDIGRAAGKRDA